MSTFSVQVLVCIQNYTIPVLGMIEVFMYCNGGYLLTTINSHFKFSSKDNRGRCETQDVNNAFSFGDQCLLM